jgi:hypothetical protein
MWKAVFVSLVALGLAGHAEAAEQPPSQTAQAPSAPHIAQYQALMELNGVTQNVRNVVENYRATTKGNLLAKLKAQALTAAQQKRFDALAQTAWNDAADQAKLIIARDQSGAFSDGDIGSLIAAYSSEASHRYVNMKSSDQEDMSKKIQAAMVDAVVAIVGAAHHDMTALNDKHAGDVGPSIDKSRVALARKVMAVDGTAALIRDFVSKSHMPLVMNEVKNHVDASVTPAILSTYSASAETTLVERILTMNAARFAAALSAADLTALATAYDIPAQRKLTELRLRDTGATDAEIGKLFDATMAKILSDFSAGK